MKEYDLDAGFTVDKALLAKVTGSIAGKRGKALSRKAAFEQAERRRTLVLELLAQGYTTAQACEQIGAHVNTYYRWRKDFPKFAARADAARIGYYQRTRGRPRFGMPNMDDGSPYDAEGNLRVPLDPDRPVTDDPELDGVVLATESARFGYARARWFDHVSPAFQLEIVEAFETLPPGNILIVLLPPEHGKTTLFEDYASLKLAANPDHRFHVASESISLSRKILGRVQHRMQADTTPYPEWVATHGPFSPQPSAPRQIWTQDYMNVYRKGAQDERDYSMTALGFGSQIIGSRSDHLHGDDLQSLKSLNQTEKYVNTIRQDWLSRTGETGRNTFAGNRVDEGDVWEGLTEAFDPDLCQVIRYPPVITDADGTVRPLWEGRWTLEQLDRMRRKVGDAVWERNWMQRPRAKTNRTFSPDQVDPCLNPLVMLGASRHDRTGEHLPRSVYVGLDPAIGSRNAMVACAVAPDCLTVVGISESSGLYNNEAIMADLERFLTRLQGRGFDVTDVVIEAKNFQAGLARDERLGELRDRFGFAVREHLTGVNKYDENIGVPSLSTTLAKRQLVLPWAGDDETQRLVGALRTQFFAWRPGARGNKLRQDLLMALWFVWILWRNRRGVERAETNTFDHRAMPYAPTRTGLLVPVGSWR